MLQGKWDIFRLQCHRSKDPRSISAHWTVSKSALFAAFGIRVVVPLRPGLTVDQPIHRRAPHGLKSAVPCIAQIPVAISEEAIIDICAMLMGTAGGAATAATPPLPLPALTLSRPAHVYPAHVYPATVTTPAADGVVPCTVRMESLVVAAVHLQALDGAMSRKGNQQARPSPTIHAAPQPSRPKNAIQVRRAYTQNVLSMRR